jgi:hypothetical protein
MVPDGSRWFQMVVGNVNALTVNDLSQGDPFPKESFGSGELSETNWNHLFQRDPFGGTTCLKLINLINLQSFRSDTN